MCMSESMLFPSKDMFLPKKRPAKSLQKLHEARHVSKHAAFLSLLQQPPDLVFKRWRQRHEQKKKSPAPLAP